MKLIKIFSWVLIVIGFYLILTPYIQGFTGFVTGYFVTGKSTKTVQTDFNIYNFVIGSTLAVVGLIILKLKKTISVSPM